MTPEERKDYEALPLKVRKYYDLYAGMHPDWGHNQLLTMAIICGQGIQPRDNYTIKEIIYECIRKADAFMMENFPNVYPSVKEGFKAIGIAINNAARLTWEYIIKLISKIS